MSGAASSGETAVVFPGQGAQRADMARDFHDASATAREAFEEASDACGLDLRAIVFGGDERLHETEVTQPAILAAEIAMWRALVAEHGLAASHFGGHSLGEYAALVAAGVLGLADAARLVRRRGALMQEAVPLGEGAMIAVVARDLDEAKLREAISDLEADPANRNSPSQIVVSGRRNAIDEARRRLGELGWRCIPLEVSAPFHSRLMAPIEPAFAEELGTAAWDAAPAARVASNFTGRFHEADEAQVRENLVRQVSGAVRWIDDMRLLAGAASRILEIGPAKPLSRFFREIGVTVVPITTLAEAEAALG